MSDFKGKKYIQARSVVRSEKSYSRALAQFRVILLDNLAVIWWRIEATLIVRHAVSNGTYRIERALNRGGSKGGATGPCPPQTMDEKLKLSCRAYMLVLQLPLMTINSS